MKPFLFGLLCCVTFGCNKDTPRSTNSVPPKSQQTPASSSEPTNTAINERDRGGATKTPLDQNENKKDVETTADIRKRVVDTKMSVEAHNIKIITQDGKVTLRGPVKSDEEKAAIEKIAADVAGADQVDSQLEVSDK